jgi:hypothetical protein
MKEKVENKQQPMKASMLPGKIKGNMEASKASDMAKSKLPGAGFIVMEAGADPNRAAEHDNGPAGDAMHAQIESGPGGLGMRTKTGLCQSPYHVS